MKSDYFKRKLDTKPNVLLARLVSKVITIAFWISYTRDSSMCSKPVQNPLAGTTAHKQMPALLLHLCCLAGFHSILKSREYQLVLLGDFPSGRKHVHHKMPSQIEETLCRHLDSLKEEVH